MRRTCPFLVLWTLTLSVPAAVVAAEPVPRTLAIGAAAPNFKLPGVDGREYSLKDFASARIVVVVFTCNHCPTAQERIRRLHADYWDHGVALVAFRAAYRDRPGSAAANYLVDVKD